MSPFKRGDKGLAQIHLNDEAPRIGCGLRVVEYHVGNTHVRLRNPHNGRTAKIPREMFAQVYRKACTQLYRKANAHADT
jgi:hypothetical protein